MNAARGGAEVRKFQAPDFHLISRFSSLISHPPGLRLRARVEAPEPFGPGLASRAYQSHAPVSSTQAPRLVRVHVLPLGTVQAFQSHWQSRRVALGHWHAGGRRRDPMTTAAWEGFYSASRLTRVPSPLVHRASGSQRRHHRYRDKVSAPDAEDTRW